VPKLVATDLDGTLLHSDGTVTERTRRVLAALEEQGVTVVFVTGRPIRWMDALWEHVGGHGLAVCSNGGIVYDVHAREVAEARTIPLPTGLEVGRLLRQTDPGVSFAVERTDGFGKEPDYQTRAPVPAGLQVGPRERLLTGQVVKLLVRHEGREPEPFWAEVEDQVGHLVTTTWSSTSAMVEISGLGVTKASTLEMLCAERGVAAEEVVAFGDMPNDLPMLAWAGTSYAMANAHSSVRELAGDTAPGNDEDGVAVVLERLFGL
jgi:Cof subfamily protein (haloacid dehalogenase superfamily)